jgi:DNA-binding XRE family transcriptional regulator
MKRTTPRLPPAEFWRDRRGLDLVHAALRPGGRELEAKAATVGAKVRALRRASGRTAIEVAEAAGMARSNFARLEADRHEPRLGTLRRVAEALDVPLEALLR